MIPSAARGELSAVRLGVGIPHHLVSTACSTSSTSCHQPQWHLPNSYRHSMSAHSRLPCLDIAMFPLQAALVIDISCRCQYGPGHLSPYFGEPSGR